MCFVGGRLELSDSGNAVTGQDRPGKFMRQGFCISLPPIAQPGAEDHDANDKDCRPSQANQPGEVIWRHRGMVNGLS